VISPTRPHVVIAAELTLGARARVWAWVRAVASVTTTKAGYLDTSVHRPIRMGPKRKSATPTPASALEQLQQSQSLKLLAIAETLSPKDVAQSVKKRNSAASEDSEQNGDTHPAALEADLLHYKVGMVSKPTLGTLLTGITGIVQQATL